MIIVEGIDRVGKTTLINNILEDSNFKSIKYKGLLNLNELNNKNETDKMYQQIQLLSLFDTSKLIFDRYYMTDFVYGIIERNYNYNDALINFKFLDTELKKLNCKLVFIKPTSIEWSSAQHGKDLTQYEKLFEELLKMTKLDYFICDFNSLNKAKEWILKEDKNE